MNVLNFIRSTTSEDMISYAEPYSQEKMPLISKKAAKNSGF